ncbi:restriction endonuclease subunit S [uncultured Methanobrevibacter sp.]|uniref:restriction endonuclease subunit S n=1 Tax=uncultured Methanobrevibacter sp. TaxID=253161 RepID=UPI0025DBBA64|nr:restriction endonuclease subunit S [uncultured Methanobrevibacter sp.]
MLRFSGFNEGWESTKIGEIAKIVGGGTPKTEVEEYWNGEIKWFTPSEIGKTKYILDSGRHITEEGLKNSSAKLLPANTILLSSRATVGEISIALTECSTNQGFQSLITNNNVDNDFVYYLISTIKNEFIRRASGSTFLEISKNEIKRIPITIPTLSEQKKISNLFSAIDNKIEILQKKYQYYRDFKKYLMQQIFAQKLRFDYDDEWKTMRLNEIVFYQEGPGVRNYQYTKKGVKLLNVGNFVKNVLNLDNTDRYISEDEAYGKYNHFLVDEGDLLIACSGIKAEYFDEKIAFAEKKHLPLCMNTSTMRFKSLDENILNLKYLKCYFQTESFKKQVFSVMTGSAQFNFGPTHLKYFKIPIPSIDEQKEIYKLFGSVDDKISMINQELDKVNEFKKSLLQQMFDNMPLLFKFNIIINE